MEKIDYCYHTHTKRCGHAFGEDEEYVLAAIKYGIKRLGFSDHVFLKGYSQPGIRGDYKDFQDYVSSILFLKEKYKDQIEIHLGFEAEYYPEMEGYYKELLNQGIEYFILGQHCELVDGRLKWYPDFMHDGCSVEEVHAGVERYIQSVKSAFKTGLFSYIAHPDHCIRPLSLNDPMFDTYCHELLRTCEEYDIPIEINLGMMRFPNYNEEEHFYPNARFFELSKQYHLRYVMGIDAHKPEDFDEEKVQKGFDFINRHHLPLDKNYVVELKVRPYNK